MGSGCIARPEGVSPSLEYRGYLVYSGRSVPVLCFGALDNGATNYGLSYANLNNGVTNANWNIVSRPSHILSKTFLILALNNPRCGEN